MAAREPIVMNGNRPPLVGDSQSADLTWMVIRAAENLGHAFDDLAREAGLSDLRAWFILTLAADGSGRTQLDICKELGIDKSTMVTLLDKLEGDGLIVRRSSMSDRRIRIPETTEAGKLVQRQVDAARDAAILKRLSSVDADKQRIFRDVIWELAGGIHATAGDEEAKASVSARRPFR
jgi:DNA-binding MarR family transcriptional regulator